MQELLPNNFSDRHELMSEGMAELRLWLKDRIAGGLAGIISSDDMQVEAFARRLVDTKLGSIARILRQANASADNIDWPEKWTTQLADWYLLSKTWSRLFTLDEAMQLDLLQLAGLNIRKKDLLEQEGVHDDWFIFQVKTGTEDQLQFRKTWVYGLGSESFGLLLDYVWGDGTFEQEFKTGTTIHGELIFYPSSLPVRAIIRPGFIQKFGLIPSTAKLTTEQVTHDFARQLKDFPWLSSSPVYLGPSFIRSHNGSIYLVDEYNRAVPVSNRPGKSWRWISLTAHQKASFFGFWSGRSFRIASAIQGDRFIS